MTLVLDAAAAVDLLVRSDAGERVRARLAREPDAVLLTVAHLDAEVLSALARLHRAGVLDDEDVPRQLGQLARLGAQRLPVTSDLLQLAWALRANVAARDALYVAAARALGGRVLTTDARLARAVPDVVVLPD